jgi:hypothetical protein
MTILIARPTGLIPQPGRTVNTFPSGLIRVDQSYLGLTSQATTHRAMLAVGNNMPDGNSSPSLDGLKIFPEAQERLREDGFTEYIVSAYGRLKSTASIERSIKSFSRVPYSFIRGTATAKIVSHLPPDFNSINFPSDAFDPIFAYNFFDIDATIEADLITKIVSSRVYSKWKFDFGSVSVNYIFLQPGINIDRPNTIPLNLTISQTNFGYWTEWVFAYV